MNQIIFATILFLTQPLFAKSDFNYLSIGVRQPSLELVFDNQGSDQESELREVTFAPQIPTIVVLGTSYKHIGLSVSMDTDQSEDAADYVDYRTSLLFERFGFFAGYTEFERFKIVETTGFSAPPEGDLLKRSSMAARFISMDLAYFPISINYSLEHSLEFHKIKKWGLGLGVMASYAQTDFATPNGLVPQAMQEAFGPDGKMEAGSFATSGVRLVLGLTLAPGPLYFSTLFGAGRGNQSFHYETADETREGEGHSDIMSMRINFGYAGKAGFVGFLLEQLSPNYILKFMSIETASTDIAVNCGINL